MSACIPEQGPSSAGHASVPPGSLECQQPVQQWAAGTGGSTIPIHSHSSIQHFQQSNSRKANDHAHFLEWKIGHEHFQEPHYSHWPACQLHCQSSGAFADSLIHQRILYHLRPNCQEIAYHRGSGMPPYFRMEEEGHLHGDAGARIAVEAAADDIG